MDTQEHTGNLMKKGILALVILNVIQASMGIFAREFNQHFDLFFQVFLRMLAALIFSIIIFKKDIHFQKITQLPIKEWKLIAIRAILMYITGIAFITVAFIYGTFSNVAFILSLPFTAIIGIPLLKQKITIPLIFVIALSFLGVVILSVENFAEVAQFNIGSGFALIGSASVALANLLRPKHGLELNNTEIGAVILFVATLLLGIISLVRGENFIDINWSLGLVFLIAIAGILNAILVIVTNFGFSIVKPIFANNILATKSIFGLLIGVLIYGEGIRVMDILGGTVILGSLFLYNYLNSKS